MSEVNAEKKYSRSWGRKIFRLVFFVIFVFLISGVSLILIDDYLFPRLVSSKWPNKYEFLKKAKENVVVVNKTEQVTVSEDQFIANYSNKAASSVIEIVSRRKDLKSSSRSGDESNMRFGSGLIVTADGLIITYRDAIIEDQAEYKIFISADRAYDARTVLVDPFTNLAFLKIDGVEGLSTASFIASEDMKTGAKIVAIGRSGSQFQPIFHLGLVSQFASEFSLAGPIASSEKMQGVYIADIDSSFETSDRMVGGAITDYSGNVAGLTGIRKMAGQKQFFIVPVEQIEQLMNRYFSGANVKRGELGIYYLPITKEAAAANHLAVDRGAMVFSPSLQQGLAVLSGSAADKAGVKISDIILSVGGEEVDTNQNLSDLVAKYKPGDEVELGILRDGKEIKLKATLQ